MSQAILARPDGSPSKGDKMDSVDPRAYSCPHCSSSRDKETTETEKVDNVKVRVSRTHYKCGTHLKVIFDGCRRTAEWIIKCKGEMG